MKRNLVYVSFLLMIGLLGLTGTAFGQATVFGVSSLIDQARHEGLAEATGQIVLTSSSVGAIVPGSVLTFTYGTNLAVAVSNANVSCSANWCGAADANITTAGAVGTNIVTITFGNAVNSDTIVGSTLTLSGVRVDANALASGLINATVSAVVPAASASTNPITFTGSTTVPVANVNATALTVNWDSGPASILACLPAVPTPNPIELTLTENFAGALTSKADENGLSGVGTATNGSQVVVTFTNVPVGLEITPTINEGANETTPVLYTPDAITIAPANFTSASGSQNATFTFTFTQTNTTILETLVVDFTLSQTPTITSSSPSVTSTVSLGPTSSSDVPYFSGTPEAPAVTTISITQCITNLLFPWVAVDAPGGTFDTGIAIANTTTDPWNTASPALPGGAVAQAGSCALTGYPISGSAVTASVGPIASGSTGTIVLSSQTTWAGFRGYIIGICQFQNAHAFAFITQDNMTDTGTSQGYLAMIIPNPSLVPRNPAGGGRGESLGF